MKIAITGAAGFIGFHLSLLFLKKKYQIIGIDNLNSYYDVNLKKKRLEILKKYKNFKFYKVDISNKKKLFNIFENEKKIHQIIHLAAQAGVRYSLINPDQYLKSNIIGFFNILEICRNFKISNLYFASTSSVYGDHNKLPFNEDQNIMKPLQFYSATKVSNEVMAYAYSLLYNFRAVGFRFFTVYGPLGRPDMAIFTFIKNIFEGKKISLFNNGNHTRDFTYIDDIVNSIYSLMKVDKLKKPQKFDIFNIGNQKREKILNVVKYIEQYTNKKVRIKFSKKETGDMIDTYSSSLKIIKYSNYKAKISIKEGLKKTILWYKEFYKID